MKKIIQFDFIISAFILQFTPLNAQVGINTIVPQGILDIVSVDSGLILSRTSDPVANVATNARAGMILFDTTNKTIRYYDGITWNTVLYTDLLQSNEGVVKLNSGSGTPVKPTFAFSSAGGAPIHTNTFYRIEYTLPLVFADPPTTSWPENIISPTQADFYTTDVSLRGRYLENPINGQVHIWRVIVAYSGKNNGSVAYLTVRMSNPDSTFSIDQTAVAPNGLSAGNLVYYLVSIADPASIGKGYIIELTSDTPLTATIDSITRISTNKD